MRGYTTLKRFAPPVPNLLQVDTRFPLTVDSRCRMDICSVAIAPLSVSERTAP
jgi:hypothetical protein